jgi:acyl-CoA dehydrogenase
MDFELTPEQRELKRSVRRLAEREFRPKAARWDEEETFPWENVPVLRDAGLLGLALPEAYGGAGGTVLDLALAMEELARCCVATAFIVGQQNGFGAKAIALFGTDAQRGRHLPAIARGERLVAWAMSEPGAGSDLQAVKTTAIRKGDKYVVNGSKTFITNGWNCDLVIVVAKTDPAKGAKGTSLVVVDTSMKGFSKGKRLKKMGLKGQDTAELFFDNVEVPAENLLGQENNGFIYLMQELPWERMQIAIGAAAKSEAALGWTIAYVNDRKAFGKPVSSFQNTRFKLAEVATEVQVMRVFVDRCMELLLEKKLDTATASMAKYWASDMENKVIDECLQLHGGYGFMWEFPIAQAYVDARVQRIYGGTNEIMKEVISRSLGLGGKD